MDRSEVYSYYYYYITADEVFFFTPALGDSLSMKFEQQQVSSNLQDSCQWSSQSEHCDSLDVLSSSPDF